MLLKIRLEYFETFSILIFNRLWKKESISFSRVLNLREGEDPNQETVIDNIKISRGEMETIFCMVFFLV